LAKFAVYSGTPSGGQVAAHYAPALPPAGDAFFLFLASG
jgi:hypothetical protein